MDAYSSSRNREPSFCDDVILCSDADARFQDDKLRIWRSFKLGKLADMIMLDTRQYDRSITDLYYNTPAIIAAAGDEDRSLTGPKQEAWLFEQLRASKERGATWPLLMQQIVFSRVNYSIATGGATEFNVDAWEGCESCGGVRVAIS